MADDFALPPGAAFARVLDTEEGQIVATLEANDDGNASIMLRRWTSDGFGTLVLGVAGARSPGTDHLFAENFEAITPAAAIGAWNVARIAGLMEEEGDD